MSLQAKIRKILEMAASRDEWWKSLSLKEQKAYLKAHPNSKLKVTVHPIKLSPTRTNLSVDHMRTSGNSFLTLLTLLQMAYRRSVPYKTLEPLFTKHLKTATDFAKKHGIKAEPFIKAFDYIKSGKNLADSNRITTGKFDDLMGDIHYEVTKNKRKWIHDHNLTDSQVQLANSVLRMMSREIDKEAIDRHEKGVEQRLRILNEPKILQLYSPEYKDQSPIVKKVTTLVKRMTGKPSPALTMDQAKSLRESDPESYKLYLKLRGDINKIAKSAIGDYLRGKNTHAAPVPEVRKHLESNGVKIHPLRKAFDPLHVMEDHSGKVKLATTTGKEIDAFPGPEMTVIMNPKYNPSTDDTYVFHYSTPENPKGNVAQTLERKQGRYKSKFEDKVQPAIAMWPKAKPIFIKDLMSNDPNRNTLGLIMTLLDGDVMKNGTVARIGTNPSDSKGMTTWRVRNVGFLANGSVRFKYEGKKDVSLKHDVLPNTPEGKRAIQLIKKLVAGKAPKDYVFTVDDVRVTPTDVNNYMKDELKLPITAHKIRSVKGTLRLQQELARRPLKKNASYAEAQKFFKDKATKVGEMLGHFGSTGKVTPTTAIKSYLDPSLGKQWFESRGFRVPEWLARITGE